MLPRCRAAVDLYYDVCTPLTRDVPGAFEVAFDLFWPTQLDEWEQRHLMRLVSHCRTADLAAQEAKRERDAEAARKKREIEKGKGR